MAPELNKQNIQAVQVTIGNMMTSPEIRPKGSETLFGRLERASENAGGVENAISEAKRSMNNLMDQRSKLMGAIDTIYDIIAEQLTDEDVQKHGSKPIQDKKNELPTEESAQG